ncbi:hypothetical protein Nepgr_013355 [Nepenthes gracilis]|uniref:Uncharacterized protein n=1 Tax=Nepenthes gracilis TaxID=150966 RepID=A0AAD3SIQ6_NEPGR|nr:hypothetical protein Nepgr_013355 [Nepenthes gracilis]
MTKQKVVDGELVCVCSSRKVWLVHQGPLSWDWECNMSCTLPSSRWEAYLSEHGMLSHLSIPRQGRFILAISYLIEFGRRVPVASVSSRLDRSLSSSMKLSFSLELF